VLQVSGLVRAEAFNVKAPTLETRFPAMVGATQLSSVSVDNEASSEQYLADRDETALRNVVVLGVMITEGSSWLRKEKRRRVSFADFVTASAPIHANFNGANASSGERGRMSLQTRGLTVLDARLGSDSTSLPAAVC
jgi:hypothetical protein